MRLVVVESPFAGNKCKNKLYARLCLQDCFMRSEAPFASHLLYTQPFVLDDDISDERKLGIEAGLAWVTHADLTAVYTDFGISTGMQLGIDHAEKNDRKIEYRQLPKNTMAEHFSLSEQ